MSSASTLIELGERYAALGLPAAARGAFVRALQVSADDDATAARRLAELALAAGDGRSARDYAKEVVKREPGPGARVLLGRAQLAAGELAAARFSFAAALDAPGALPLTRARAHLGRGITAAVEGDPAGAAANIMAGVDAFLEFAGAQGRLSEDVDAELAVVDELLSRAVGAERVAEVAERLDELARRRPEAPVALLGALFLAARQSHGDEVPDSDIEAALARELERRPTSRTTRVRLIERRLRRRYRDDSARREAIEDLERLVREMSEAPLSVAESVELARVYFLLAAAYEDDPATLEQAEELYRKGLGLRPGHATAANRLALLTLARGDSEAALVAIERALRIDAGHGLAWRNAARVLDASSPGPGLPEVVGRLLDAAEPGAGTAAGAVAPRLVTATAEVARSDVLAGMYTRGHRLKNVLGIIGSRTRSARKLAGEGELSQRLADLESEVTALYNEWATYLRSMQTAGPVVEVVPAGALVQEVVEAASAKSSVPVALCTAGALPDLRGDRMLLREALLNIVSNAAEACAGSGGEVEVSARVVTTGSTPIIEIEVADSGPGIARADLGRIFAPGFTTKETGSGVGLTIAERVVTAHNGRILVDSEAGRGTRVTVVLPTDLGGFTTLAALSERDRE
jgi:signal transduction histidine kinase